jgi:cytochrome c biogenesis protein CcmG/thiol:disulfide interchange protein DsbE
VTRVAIAVAMAALVVGCSSSGGAAPTPGPDPNLVKAADLAPCPASSLTAVAGGLPDITLPCLAPGRSVHLAGMTGKPTVINVWGSWCEPCQTEEKYLASAYDALKPKARFLGIDIVDSANSALDFDAHVTPPVRFPSVFDENRKAAIALGVTGPPATFFVSAAGKLVGQHLKPYTSAAEITADIRHYLHVSA